MESTQQRSKYRKALLFGAWLVFFAVFFVSADIIYNKYYGTQWSTFGPESQLSVLESSGRYNGDVYEILGTVLNGGETEWTGITLSADLFDGEGIFVDQCRERLRVPFPPGAKEHFKVTCGGCSNRTLPDFETYQVRVVDASTF